MYVERAPSRCSQQWAKRHAFENLEKNDNLKILILKLKNSMGLHIANALVIIEL
jgi:hypothetical protein